MIPAASEEAIGIGAMTAPEPASPFRTAVRASRQPLTPADALKRARAILSTPDQLFSTDEGRRIIEALLVGIDSSPAFAKALMRGDELFCLVRQDRCAPFAIRAWAEIAARHGAPVEKVHDAQRIALRWDNTTVQRKWPD